ncbi:P-loop containing nucleoside triphosphate hydrolase protein [Hyaloscypha hepaticicola]|uniref:P-loop containing nucleoside triphosphate hydrolase protein n=1 Tax=Hyaloscypha hepaticicola TaxID=2082293 RepID=A0A2J6Q4D0_9HELO|nr:P-loop containing nucleoside triphosphate hydrolase protein [Hyaloscypha hepaticicola]
MEIATTPKYTCSDSLSKQAHPQAYTQPLTSQDLEQLILKLIDAKSNPPKLSEAAKPDALPEAARASKLECKTVTEVWDEEKEEYTIDESLERKVKTFDEYVSVMRTRIDRNTKDAISYVDIKSEELRDVLREVLKDVYGISLMVDKSTVERNLLYHYLPELESYRSRILADAAKTTPIEHLGLLINCVRTIYMPTSQNLLPLLDHGEITYDLLPLLFKPNTLVYTTCFGTKKPRCVIYDSVEEKEKRLGEKYFSMACRYLDFDGKTFGTVPINLAIPKFRGTKRINTLRAFPLKYYQDEKLVKANIVECGRKFVALKDVRLVHCRGEAFYMDEGDPVRLSVDSRVIIDPDFFWKMNPNYSRPRTDLDVTRPNQLPPGWSSCTVVKSNGIEPAELTEDDLLICCPTVLGFSFGEKIWAEFAVADIEHIEWLSLPFDCLSISDEQRDVIMALVEACNDPSAVFDDVIAGKGRGLNILLHGRPGLGKTLTVEAVAELLKRPLYSISAGELLIDTAKLEAQLSRIFKIASHWNAILLLDEADIFLEKRMSENLTRNSLVSVFLRKLEYCEGIMFLTTNRVAEFDPVILSRIHVMLRYGDLIKDSGKKVWKQFIVIAKTSQGEARISSTELQRLVSSKLNGRQIKNVMATVQALAKKEKSRVCFFHIQKTVTASKEFISEFNGGVEMSHLYL